MSIRRGFPLKTWTHPILWDTPGPRRLTEAGEGVVQLNGLVLDDPECKEARIIAHSVSGVLAVDNRLHTEKEEKVA